MLSGPSKWYAIIDSYTNLDQHISNFSASTLSADGIAPSGAGKSAGTVMTKCEIRIYTGPELEISSLVMPWDYENVFHFEPFRLVSENVIETINIFDISAFIILVSTVPADDLAPLIVRTSAGTMMPKFVLHAMPINIYICIYMWMIRWPVMRSYVNFWTSAFQEMCIRFCILSIDLV